MGRGGRGGGGGGGGSKASFRLRKKYLFIIEERK